jgi:hypothetical protein
LEQIGFQPQDISRLAEEALARGQPGSAGSPGQGQPTNEAQAGDFNGTAFVKAEVAGWVAKLIQANPAESAAFLPEVQRLLADPDSEVRFWAACALLQRGGAQNPVVVNEVSLGLKHGSPSRIAWASKLLEGLGEAAVPIVPALLKVAKTSTGNPRDWAFLSAGRIQSGLRAEVPEIDQSLAKDEADRALCDELNSQHHTAKNLSVMLQDPGRAAVAARLLAEQFPLAKITLPALCAAVPLQQAEKSRNAILTSIRKLDPTAALAPEDVTSIVKSLSNLGSTSEEDRALGELLDKNHRLGMSWSTRPGFQTFAADLALENPIAYKAFVSAILERAPSWKGLLPATSQRESR